jgi:hypothetical protein
MKKKRITVSIDESDELLREAYDNSYRILFEGLRVKDLMRECVKEDKDLYVTYFIEEGPGLEDMYDMLFWYEDEEWYERCVVIKEYMDKNFKRKD